VHAYVCVRVCVRTCVYMFDTVCYVVMCEWCILCFMCVYVVFMLHIICHQPTNRTWLLGVCMKSFCCLAYTATASCQLTFIIYNLVMMGYHLSH